MLCLYCLLHRPRLNYMSTHLISPHKIFNSPLPSPPQWSKQRPVLSDVQQATLPQWRSAISESCLKIPYSSFLPVQWKEGNDSGRSLKRTLDRFSRALRSVHKRKINWPTDESFPNEWAYPVTWSSSSNQFHSLSPQKYMEALLFPILHLYHQLHSESTLQKSCTLELRDIDVDGGES